MIDETQGAGWSNNPQSTAPTEADTSGPQNTGATAEPVAYCQDCGRPLTETTIRRVGRSIFCEPCLQVRLGGQPGSATSGAVPPPPYSPTGSMPPIPGEPSPALAGLLGFIPGVGAMYNGQFAKGIAHIIIFTILTSLANHVSDAFGLLVAGWVFYQVFDAIHTARARRDGLPLPNTFGLNDIGERMGYGGPAAARPTGQQPPVPPAPSQTWSAPPTPPPSASQPESLTATPAGTAWQQASAPVPPAAYANWAGYIPPESFSGAAPLPPAGTGYQETYTGTTPNWTGTVPPPPDLPPSRQIPAAALWLIAFGILFLIANVVSWHFSIRWAAPVALWIFAAWSLYRRLDMSDRLRARADAGGSPYLISLLRVPVFLALLAILFTLQSLDLWTLGQTWPLLLIASGGFLILERSGSYNAVPPAAPWPPQTPIVPPTAPPSASSHGPSSPHEEPR